ncbi:YciI family protein [Microlunatus ginsengisoli]|uniref:YciI family protein n=1 Tax=Microlunatus ginsengisoli TaxID=363863 RepID=A0ABP6ZZV6_9ACTN
MKYVLMYTSTPELMADVPAERQQEVYQAIYGWFGKYADSFADGGAELQEPTTATSVKSAAADGAPVVVDGPFSEAKESIGGFSVVDVDDLDVAIGMAKEWPMLVLPGCAVEIRPIVDHSDDMPM